jgi:peptidoglycan/LPS O-acetylase OafA/YrhL
VTSRNPSLDVLRGAAVLAVAGHHYGYYELWARGGGAGVDLFFVLSGFLISGLLFSEFKSTGRIDTKRFLIRRGLKIYPAYYCFVFVLLPFTAHQLKLADLTFMGAYFPTFWGHAWSLSVEEHFYLILPIILILSGRLFPGCSFRWIPWAMPILCIVCLYLRYEFSLSHSVVFGINATHMRIDALFAGVTLGWFRHFQPNQLQLRNSSVLALIGIVLVLPEFANVTPAIMASAGSLAALLGFSLLLIWALNSQWLGKLNPIAWIGTYSYSIYLWHLPLARLFQGTYHNNVLAFWSYVMTAIVVGVGMAKLVELPVLKLRDRFFPSFHSLSSKVGGPFNPLSQAQ